jgi:hypothetical protein
VSSIYKERKINFLIRQIDETHNSIEEDDLLDLDRDKINFSSFQIDLTHQRVEEDRPIDLNSEIDPFYVISNR